MIKLYDNKKECCGCTACEEICPKKCIDMIEDNKGFLYPHIDINKCVECKQCINVCDFKRKSKIRSGLLDKYRVYAVKHKNDNIRKISASGGAFTAFSDYVLEKGGIVYGAIYDDNLKVYHDKALNSEERDRMCGSKYVQSRLDNVFSEIKEFLDKKLLVMFTGTPCQVAGLKSFLKDDYNNLVTLDIICHGTPSQKMFKDTINYIENDLKKKIVGYNNRYKPCGLQDFNDAHKEMIAFDDGSIDYSSIYANLYKNLFHSTLSQRESCYVCKYASSERYGDITIGDFWREEKDNSGFDDDKGISFIMINTQKGMDIFSEIREKVDYVESNLEDTKNPQLHFPVKRHSNVDVFWNEYGKFGFKYIAKKYGKITFSRKVKYRIKKILFILGIRK